MRTALLVVAAVTLTGTAHAGGGIAVPPVELDFGIGAPVRRMLPSTEILAGLHWASLYWKPTRFDVGAGYVGSYRVVGDGETSVMHGCYLSFATRFFQHEHWRGWIATRGELLRATHDDRSQTALGGALRISAEWFKHVFDRHRGIAAGTFGLGVFLELTYRDVPKPVGQRGGTLGVTIRLPFAAGS